MNKIEKLQKFLSTFTPSVYWPTSYNGKEPIDINNDDPNWNQTLVTKINEVAARIYKDDGGLGPETILISGKYSDMQSLIHSLLYFKANITYRKDYYFLGKLAGKYDVKVIPQLDNDLKIFVCKLYDEFKEDPFNVPNYQKVAVVQVQKLNE